MIRNLLVLTVLVEFAFAGHQYGSQSGSHGDGSPMFNLKPDGSYSFSYNTETGGFQKEQKTAGGGVSGSYGFSGPEGSSVNVQYSAAAGGDGAGKYEYSQPKQPAYQQPRPAPQQYGGSGSSGSYSLKLNHDGSYNYEYNLNDQAKSESRGTDGRVKGQFSYTGKDGQSRKIQYTADEGGFKPIGDHIPVADQQQAAPSYSHQGSSYSGGASSYSSGASHYSNGASNNGGSGTLNMKFNPGGHYEYSYKLNDQSKSESNAGGKVMGQYSYTGPDGQNRAVTYTADEGGFQPIGDHIPKPSAEFLEAHREAAARSSSSGGHSSYEQSNHGQSSGSAYSDRGYGAGQSHGGSYGAGQSQGGSYSFNYAAGAHGHQESSSGGQSQGQYNVQSSGAKQKTHYTAGKTGFLPTHDIVIQLGGNGLNQQKNKW